MAHAADVINTTKDRMGEVNLFRGKLSGNTKSTSAAP